MYYIDFDDCWDGMKKFKVYIFNNFDKKSAPTKIAEVVSILEGGYNLNGLAKASTAHVQALLK